MSVIETITIVWHDLATDKPTEYRDVIVKHKGANSVTHRCNYILASRLDDLWKYDESYEWAYVGEIRSERENNEFIVCREDNTYLHIFQDSNGSRFRVSWSPDINDALVFTHDRAREVMSILGSNNPTTFDIYITNKK